MSTRVEVHLDPLVIPGDEIELLEVEDALDERRRCYLEFDSRSSSGLGLRRSIRPSALINRTLRVVSLGTVERAVFSGVIVRLEEVQLTDGTQRFHLGAESSESAGSDHVHQRSFRNHTLASVVSALGASLVGSPTDPRASTPLNYVQAASNWEYLKQLAAEFGLFLREGDAGIELRAGFSDVVHVVEWDSSLLALSSEAEVRNGSAAGAFFDHTKKHDHRFLRSSKSPDWLSGMRSLVESVERAARTTDPELMTFRTRAPALADFGKRLESASARQVGRSVRMRGCSTVPTLRAGDRLEITGPGAEEAGVGGTVGIVAVTHVWDHQTYENAFELSPFAGYSNELPGHATLAALRAAGVETAIVMENRDPQRLGRIRIRRAWEAEPARSGWARVCAPYAGKGRGLGFLPEVGDEILIAFEQGDAERPVVLGALWNGLDQPVHSPSVKQWTTRSGNTVRLDDTDGREVVEVFSAAGKCLVRLANEENPTITVHSEGDIAIEAPNGRLQVTCKELLGKVSGNASVDVVGNVVSKAGPSVVWKSTGGVTIASSQNLTLTSRGGVSLQANMECTIGGALVQLNPPGARALVPAQSIPKVTPSVWRAQTAPAAAPGLSTERNPHRIAPPPPPTEGPRFPTARAQPWPSQPNGIDDVVAAIQREFPEADIRPTGGARTVRRQAELMARSLRSDRSQFLSSYRAAPHITEMDEWLLSNAGASEEETIEEFVRVIERARSLGARVSNHLSDSARDISWPAGTEEELSAIESRVNELGATVLREPDSPNGPHWHVDF